ncbi:cytokinin dehydrogenase 2-like [Lotus japonicus]|uniref:cytokinin dehydrogenase n=1 Tax=Lotus japonicus TaxID=34305 RepID=I3T7E3_LOTJA|nr:cytokinin dehydrogenase 2-like [Lotus japonicus]AFK48435.1 unknown [Lotus japonicus]
MLGFQINPFSLLKIARPKVLILLWLNIIVLTHAALSPYPWSPPKDIANKFSRDPATLSQVSSDFGLIFHRNSSAVFTPTSISDISKLIKFSNSLSCPFTIAPRGQGHASYGQAMTRGGVVVNMTALNDYRNGSGIVVHHDKQTPYVDVGGEQIWIDVLRATFVHGLTPFAWTDYLYLSIGATLSNGGINGRAFRFGPQISNVHELDVVTGKGDLVTCSANKNSDLFYAVLGGLGQFGIITRARIPLGPAPTRVKWVHMLYNDFSTFSKDQEHLITFKGRNGNNQADFVEGVLMLNQPSQDLSFYPESDQPRIISLVTQYDIIYVMELVKYYDDNTQDQVDQEIEDLIHGLKFIPTFKFDKNASYEEFQNRIRTIELTLKPLGLWDVPHPWLDLYVPGSRIMDFDEGVFKGIILKQNITARRILVYATNQKKWDDKTSAMTPDEDFYIVSILPSTRFDNLELYLAQNQQVLQFCEDAGIGAKQYTPHNKTQEEWVEYYGPKWKTIQQRKLQFDPNKLLAPGQGIFN